MRFGYENLKKNLKKKKKLTIRDKKLWKSLQSWVLLFCHILKTKSWLECSSSLLNSQLRPGILRDVYSFLMQTLPFVLINSHRCWPREWKHSIHVYKVFKIQVLQSAYFRFCGDWPCRVSLTFPISRLGFACGSGMTSHDHPSHPEKTELQSALGFLMCILQWR